MKKRLINKDCLAEWRLKLFLKECTIKTENYKENQVEAEPMAFCYIVWFNQKYKLLPLTLKENNDKIIHAFKVLLQVFVVKEDKLFFVGRRYEFKNSLYYNSKGVGELYKPLKRFYTFSMCDYGGRNEKIMSRLEPMTHKEACNFKKACGIETSSRMELYEISDFENYEKELAKYRADFGLKKYTFLRDR